MCTVDVIEYEKKNQGAKYGMKTGKFAARGIADHIKEILKEKKAVGLRGLVAFGYYGAFVSAFFPSAGGLPVNPCTFATKNWGECVWQQVKPYVEKFVDKKLDETFETLWNVSIEGYRPDCGP